MYLSARRGALAPTSESCRNENLGRLQPKTLKPAEPSRPKALHPTIRPFAGTNLGSEPSAGGPSGAPKGEAQGIPKQLAVLAGAGGRQISRANANALASKGTAGRGLVAQPVGEGGDLGGGVPLGQRISRWRGGWGSAWPMRSAAAKRPEPPSSTTTRWLPGPGQPQPCSRRSKQQSTPHLASAQQDAQAGSSASWASSATTRARNRRWRTEGSSWTSAPARSARAWTRLLRAARSRS